MKKLIGTLLLGSALSVPAFAQDAPARKPLEARAEINVRGGSERSILMNEFWVPLTQTDNSVLYGDIRLMGDDQDNREFNAGVGYRHIVKDFPVIGDGVAGVHGWVDRRITERGSRFNQITAGAEWSGDVIDLKLNGYLPLSDEKNYGAVSATSAPYLAGSGIYYDITNTQVTEEPQPGLDFELGFNLGGIVDNFTDSTRIYAGLYHFAGDKSENVSGWRTRIASDITEDFQLGARFQRDDERGSQGFLEATIRFPFGNKKSYKDHGLYGRLDESPERDIDIVTATTKPQSVGVNGTFAVTNAESGTAQRVLYVDNTAAPGGIGTLDNPFNSLTDAQAALADNDVVYVARGDGTTANMNNGITINRNGVSLIGEGSAFVYDGGKFTTTANADFSGTVLKAAGLAPVVTNINVNGDGVFVMADNVLVSGLTVSNTVRDGVRVQTGNNIFDSISITNVTANNTGQRGVYVYAQGGGSYQNVLIDNVRSYSSGYDGVRVQADTNTINNVTINNITSNGSGVNSAGMGRGVLLYTNLSGQINNAAVTNITANNNISEGVYAIADNNGDMGSLHFNNINVNATSGYGLRLRSNNVNSVIGSILAENVVSTNNTGTAGNGVYVEMNAGQIGNVMLRNVTATGNAKHGIYLHGMGTSQLTAAVEDSSTTGNAQHGIAVYDDTSGTFDIDLGGGGLSAGRNILAANTLEDLALDYDGRTISAMNNWWGQATGPDQDAPNIGIRPQIYYGAPINDGLVAHWTFDTEWMNGTTAYDRSGNNNNGTFQGGLSLANVVAGQKRQALNFDGVDDYISVGNPGLGAAYTIAASFNATSLSLQRPIFGGYDGASNTQHYLSLYNPSTWRLAHDQFAPGGNQALSTNTVTTGTWYSGAGVQTSTSTRYVSLNGTVGATATETYSGGVPTQWAIGGRIDATNYRFHGAIDDVRLYNRVLTAGEIAELARMDTTSTVDFSGFLSGAP